MIFQKSVKMSLLFLFLFMSFVGVSSAQSTYLKVCEYDQTYEEGTLFGGTTELENRVGIYFNTSYTSEYACANSFSITLSYFLLIFNSSLIVW